MKTIEVRPQPEYCREAIESTTNVTPWGSFKRIQTRLTNGSPSCEPTCASHDLIRTSIRSIDGVDPMEPHEYLRVCQSCGTLFLVHFLGKVQPKVKRKDSPEFGSKLHSRTNREFAAYAKDNHQHLFSTYIRHALTWAEEVLSTQIDHRVKVTSSGHTVIAGVPVVGTVVDGYPVEMIYLYLLVESKQLDKAADRYIVPDWAPFHVNKIAEVQAAFEADLEADNAA